MTELELLETIRSLLIGLDIGVWALVGITFFGVVTRRTF